MLLERRFCHKQVAASVAGWRGENPASRALPESSCVRSGVVVVSSKLLTYLRVRSPNRAEQGALDAQDSRGTGDGHAFDSLSRETRAAVVSHILCQEVGKAHRLLENKFISKSKYELDTRCLSQD